MTAFDIAAGMVLIVSVVVGFFRGAVRELVTMVAFSCAALAAVFALPFSAPVMRHTVHTGWGAKILAVAAVFLAVYILLRVLGGTLSSALHRQSALGALDRTAGSGIGLVRGLVALGGFYLLFNFATPADLAPQWITASPLYAVSRVSGRTLAAVAPRGFKGLGGVGRALGRRISDDASFDNGEQDATSPSAPGQSPYAAPGWRAPHRRRTLVVQSDAAQAP